MSVKTLNDFLGNYLRTKKIENGEKGFAAWMAKSGLNPSGTLEEKLTDAESDFARAKPGYGTSADRLSASGLSSSGYADYLTANAYSQMRKEKVDALKDYTAEVQKSAAGYADWLSDKAEKKATLYRTVVGQISSGNLLDRDEAYAYAVSTGLDEDDAQNAADMGIAEAKKRLRTKLANAMLSGGLTKARALRYAKFLGLDDEDTALITSLFSDESQTEDGEIIPDGGAEFLDYLKKQSEK